MRCTTWWKDMLRVLLATTTLVIASCTYSGSCLQRLRLAVVSCTAVVFAWAANLAAFKGYS
jgi:hypothetical protein